MTKGQLKKQLSNYTKEQIIEALLIAFPPGTYNEHIIHQMQNYINDRVLKDENIEIDAAHQKWHEAYYNYIEYVKYLNDKYGPLNRAVLEKITKEESEKYVCFATHEKYEYSKLERLLAAQEERQLKLLQKH